MMRIIYLGLLLSIVACQRSYPVRKIYKDQRDGQEYGYVRIGQTYWMTENMRYNVEGSLWNPNNPDTIFGRLYNGYQARKACPKNWRLTRKLDWYLLEKKTLAIKTFEEISLKGWFRGKGVHKFKSKKYWPTPGTNSLKLNIVPAGRASNHLGFQMLNKGAFFWTSTNKFSPTGKSLVKGVAEFRYMHNDSVGIYVGSHIMKYHSMSCRCVRFVPPEELKKQEEKGRRRRKEGD